MFRRRTTIATKIFVVDAIPLILFGFVANNSPPVATSMTTAARACTLGRPSAVSDGIGSPPHAGTAVEPSPKADSAADSTTGSARLARLWRPVWMLKSRWILTGSML
jgi:hypothetical protein